MAASTRTEAQARAERQEQSTMTNAKHTKGPWKYALNVGPTKALIVEADGSTVVECSNRVHDSRFEANARLIAAAPELLAALTTLADVAGRIGPFNLLARDISDLSIAYGMARAVIAKAEGRAP